MNGNIYSVVNFYIMFCIIKIKGVHFGTKATNLSKRHKLLCNQQGCSYIRNKIKLEARNERL